MINQISYQLSYIVKINLDMAEAIRPEHMKRGDLNSELPFGVVLMYQEDSFEKAEPQKIIRDKLVTIEAPSFRC